MRKPRVPLALLWASSAAFLASFQFGWHMAVLNPSQSAVEASLRFPPSRAALPSASLLAAAAAGALVAGRLGDLLGPATSLAALVAPAFLAGSVAGALSRSLGWLCLARALAGAGAGATSTLVPRYLADVAPPRSRGALGAAHQVVVCVGIVAAMLAGLPYEGGKGRNVVILPSLSRLFGRGGVEPWRVALAAGAVPAALLAAVASVAAPESPSWLAFVGRSKDAALSLSRLRGDPAVDGDDGSASSGDEERGRTRNGSGASAPTDPSPSPSPPPPLALSLPEATALPPLTSPGSTKPLLRTNSGGVTPLSPRRGHGGASDLEALASLAEEYRGGSAEDDGDDHQRRPPPMSPFSATTPRGGASSSSALAPPSAASAPSSSSQQKQKQKQRQQKQALLLLSEHSHPLPGQNASAAAAASLAAADATASSSSSSAPPASTLSLLRRHRRAVSLASGLALAQQATGINTVVLYSTAVLSAAGSSRPVLAGAGVAALNAAASAASAAAADRVGRRPLLLWSYSLMAVFLSLLAASPHIRSSSSTPRSSPDAANQVGAVVAVVALLLYVASFAAGAGPVTWLYMAEILPEEVQGTAGSLSAALNWCGNFVVGSTFPSLLSTIGVTGSYGLYAALNVACFAFARARVVETARRPLAEARAAVAAG